MAALGLYAACAVKLRRAYAAMWGRLAHAQAVRPHVPPVFVCALCMWACCAVVYVQLRAWSEAGCACLLALSAVASLGVVALLLRRNVGAVWFAVLGLLLGLASASAGACAMHHAWQVVSSYKAQGAHEVTFVLAGDATEVTGGYAAQAYVEGEAALSCLQGFGPGVRLVVEDAAEAPCFGSHVTGKVRFSKPSDSYAEQQWSQGAVATAYVTVSSSAPAACAGGNVFHAAQCAVVGVRDRILGALSEAGKSDARYVLEALVCGYRGNLRNAAVYSSFKSAGLAHMVAVSGAHLAIVCSLVEALLGALRMGRRPRLALQVAFMAAYVVLAGMPVSALRAAVMAAAGILGSQARRRSSSINALGVCIVVFVGCHAWTATSLSFALSAGATAGIILFAGLFGAWVRTWFPRLPRQVASSFAMTLSANLLSAGLSAAEFSMVPLASPLSNLVAVPLLSAVCCLGLVAGLAAAAVPAAAGAVLAVPLAGSQVLCWVVDALAGIPYASIPVSAEAGVAVALSVAAAATLWWFWPRVSRIAAACVLAGVVVFAVVVGVVGPATCGTQVVALDVGQGDAILLRSQGRAVLVDTGTNDQQLLQALAKQGVQRLDAVIITHPDDDHCGSLPALKGVVGIGQVCLSAPTFTCACSKCGQLVETAQQLVGEANVVALSKGSTLTCGNFAMQVVWPSEFHDSGGNADSLCLLARADVDADGTADQTVFLCGDAERETLQTLVDEGVLGQVNVYKVGHHGSAKALTAKLAETLSPQVALISVGENNRYGHPTKAALSALEGVHARVLRTDTEGSVVCTLLKGSIQVRCVA